MTEETKRDESAEQTPEKQESVEQAPKEEIFETAGRKFNIATEEGKRDLRVWMDAVSHLTGRLAQEKGDLEKEVEPLRKYNLKNASVDEVEVMKKVEAFREEGDHVSADRLMWELNKQYKAEASLVQERERLWADYKAQNSDVFEYLPEDMAKDYVFRNYSTEIEEAEDPFKLVDRILRPKAAKFKKPEVSAPAVEEPQAVLGRGSSGRSDAKDEQKEEESDEGAFAKMLKDSFGVD